MSEGRSSNNVFAPEESGSREDFGTSRRALHRCVWHTQVEGRKVHLLLSLVLYFPSLNKAVIVERSVLRNLMVPVHQEGSNPERETGNLHRYLVGTCRDWAVILNQQLIPVYRSICFSLRKILDLYYINLHLGLEAQLKFPKEWKVVNAIANTSSNLHCYHKK